jgi:hypothetical protein
MISLLILFCLLFVAAYFICVAIGRLINWLCNRESR